MTPNPAATTAPKDIAPLRGPPPVPVIGAAFDQHLSIGITPPKPNATQSANSDPNAAQRSKAKNDSDDAKAGNAAVPVPAPPLLPAITVATSSGEAKVATAAVPTPFAPRPPAAPALGAGNATDPATVNGAAGGTGNGAKLPPGAAQLEARIVAAAPNYLSQPNAALAAFLHPGGETAKPNAPGQPGTQPPGSADAEGKPATQAQTAPVVKDAASLAKDLSPQPHATPGIEIAQAASADSAKPSTLAGSGADAPGTPAIALPSATQLAATQASSANQTLAVPVQIPTAWEQVAVNLRQAAQGGSDRIEIQLKPASLGAISVKLDLTHDGRITAVISADRSDTLNLLRQHSDALAQSLRDAGLRADTGSLSFNLRGDAQSFAQGSAPNAGGPNRFDDPAAPQSAGVELARYRLHAGAVDIEV